MRFTLGPWTVHVAIVTLCHGEKGRLIAAAPDLLAACQAALDWYGPDGDHITDPERGRLLAAIAKAEGASAWRCGGRHREGEGA